VRCPLPRRRGRRVTERLLIPRAEAAEMLGVSVRHFERHIQPHLPCVYSGQLRQYRPRDLEAWVDEEVTTRASARPDDEEAVR
jgi:hypothetical protein